MTEIWRKRIQNRKYDKLTLESNCLMLDMAGGQEKQEFILMTKSLNTQTVKSESLKIMSKNI
jgi:hypothetical protein